MKFQITQNFGNESYCYIYIEVPDNSTDNDIVNAAIKAQKEDRKKRESLRALYWSGVPVERPTIHINEWKDGEVIKNGRKLKTKWR
ncbi:hypothetical protein GCM10009120_18520 [Sphingobacterium siyangense subsp. cladoniae]|uniref:hypothetical protein n=1 Tax=Sphingobacterium siyangense TaxID=459529 RepID=UPI0031F8B690